MINVLHATHLTGGLVWRWFTGFQYDVAVKSAAAAAVAAVAAVATSLAADGVGRA